MNTKQLLTCIIFSLAACTHRSKQNDNNIISGAGNSSAPVDTLVPPVTVIAGAPVIANPDTCQPPQTIAIPTRPGGSYILNTPTGRKVIKLVPPETKHADFFVTMQNYNTEQGLALSDINCAYMDKMGNLWFGTAGGGISKYDGKSFTSYTIAQGLSNNLVWCITQDKAGNLWFGTDGGGVSKYDGTCFTIFTAQGLANNIVESISEDKTGNLWFGTLRGGVIRYDGKSFKNFTMAQGLANNIVRCITEDKTGNLWIGTNGGGVSKYDGKSFTNYTMIQGLANNSVYSITEDRTGNLWFGTAGGGVSKYDGKSFTNFTMAQGLANNSIWCITEDKRGNLWFGTSGGGVSKFDGKSFTNYSTAQGLTNNDVHSITEDMSGYLWFGTWGGGVCKFAGKTNIMYTAASGLANNNMCMITSMTEDKTGNLWIGTNGAGSGGGGVIKYDGKTFTSFTTAQGLVNNDVWSITKDKAGNLWFGTYKGVSKYDGKSFTNYTTAQGLGCNEVRSITEDNTGNIWFATYGEGVWKYNGKSFIGFTTAQGLASNSMWCSAIDKMGNLWFGSISEGVSRFDDKSFMNFTKAHGLADNTVFSIAEDKTGNLWFGTQSGLSVLSVEKINEINRKGSSRNKRLFKSFNVDDGLGNDMVAQVAEDRQENIIIGTNEGFTVLKEFNNVQQTTKPVFEIYNNKTGWPVKDINGGQGGMYIDSKGIVWAGAGDKLVRFDYSEIHKNLDPPVVEIQNIKVNNENVSWYTLTPITSGQKDELRDSVVTPSYITEEATLFGRVLSEAQRDTMRKKFGDIIFTGITRFYYLPENLVLPFNHNNVTFEFAAIETGRPFMIRYQFILEGYDDGWSPVTDKTNASFGNIHEGNYTFKLKAQSPEGVWSDPITYTFRVLPPWYRTWYMYAIYVLSSVLTIFLIFRWRMAALRREKVFLERTVAERTQQLREEKEKSENLLLNILPAETAEELKATGTTKAKSFTMVTVLFTDFKDFTRISEKVSAELLVDEIHNCFSAFDGILQKYKIEKIKTIGDSYMCASGLPVLNYTHAVDMVNAAFEIRNFMLARKKEKEAKGEIPFELRIGIHTGPVVAGIVGVKKFAYDIWGDTVNIASRMESSGEAGKVNISGTTYDLVKDKFICKYRGKIEAKNKGMIDMYFAEKQ